MPKPVVGVMGASANDALTAAEAARIKSLAEELGAAIAKADCYLVTGATTGLPDRVATSFRKHGGFALGISPAENRQEHVARYGLPETGADVIVYTGFGYKGRNVINIRSADIVLFSAVPPGRSMNSPSLTTKGRLSGYLREAAVSPSILGKSSNSATNRPEERSFDRSRKPWLNLAWLLYAARLVWLTEDFK